jgi:DNA-binding NarL/FixJ family response regulator
MRKIRLLIVDDHTLFRESLRSHLNTYENIEVVGEAGDGIEAISKTMQLQPDIVLMDFAMPNLNGLQATLQIKKNNPAVKILILTMYETGPHIYPILRAGASGYILKKAPTQELISAIQAVFQGDAFLCPSVAKQVIEEYLEQAKEGEEKSRKGLTERELELINLIAEGKTNKEMAHLLGISIHTVQAHRLNLMKKLDVHDSTQLVRYAIRRGLIIP